jgi:hypothetical protein
MPSAAVGIHQTRLRSCLTATINPIAAAVTPRMPSAFASSASLSCSCTVDPRLGARDEHVENPLLISLLRDG